jgi:hypothetical protein
MAKADDGGPAYPCKATAQTEPTKDGTVLFYPVGHCGMSLLDAFAIAVIEGGQAQSPLTRPSGNDQVSIDIRKAWARDVWALADAMLAAREK